MNPEKIGEFIKKIRKENNLTQGDLANKYGVTYQAVSKWERGLNLPDILLIKQMSDDFGISIDDILDGEVKKPKSDTKSNVKVIILIILLLGILATMIFVIVKHNEEHSYKFKTLETTCENFKVTGSIAYDKNKSSIYISNISYCGEPDDQKYSLIESSLYLVKGKEERLISASKKRNITLDNYLMNIKYNVEDSNINCDILDKYELVIKIDTYLNDNKSINYKIPIVLADNCPVE